MAGDVEIVLTAKLEQLAANLATAQGMVRGFASNINGALGGANRAFSGLVGMVSKLAPALAALAGAASLAAVVSTAASTEAAMKRLQVQVEKNGYSWQQMKPAIDATLASVRAMGMGSIQATNMLSMFMERGASTAQAMKMLQGAAAFAAATNQDLTRVTYALSLAQSGSLGYLVRVGLATKEEVAAHISLETILNRLIGTYGAAATKVDTVSQASRVFKADLEELMNTAGKPLLGVVRDLIMWVDSGVRAFTSWGSRLTSTIAQSKNWQIVLSAVKEVWQAIVEVVQSLWNLVEPVVAALLVGLDKIASFGLKITGVLVQVAQTILSTAAQGAAVLHETKLAAFLESAAQGMTTLYTQTVRAWNAVHGLGEELAHPKPVPKPGAGGKPTLPTESETDKLADLRQHYENLKGTLADLREEYAAGMIPLQKLIDTYGELIATATKLKLPLDAARFTIQLSSEAHSELARRAEDLKAQWEAGRISTEAYTAALRANWAELSKYLTPTARIAALDTLNKSLEEAATKSAVFSKAISTGLEQILDGSKRVSSAFEEMAGSILKSWDHMISEMITKWLNAKIAEMLKSAFGGGGPGGAGAAPGGFGALLNAMLGFSVPGGGGGVPGFQAGGTFQPRTGDAGLALLHRGERVVPRSGLGGSAGGGPSVVNHVNVTPVINAIDAASFENRLGQHMEAITNAVALAIARGNHPLRSFIEQGAA